MNAKILVAALALGACAKKTNTSAAHAGAHRHHATQITLDKKLGSACDIDTSAAYFEFDSTEVENDRTLASVAKCLNSGNLKGRHITIIGNADKRGTAEYNKELARDRAETVASYLESKGVPARRIATKSRGEAHATGHTDRGYARDRRVDIVLAD